MPPTVTLPDSHPTTTLQAGAPICKGSSRHRHHQELPYPASEHFLPNQASILTSFGKKCSFFNCEPCITGRSAHSLAAAHFAAEIKLQIAELWDNCVQERQMRQTLQTLQADRQTIAAIGQLRVGSSVLTGLQAGNCVCRTVSRRNVRIDRLTGKPLNLYL